MTGIGKIISGKKKQISASAQAGSRAPWITGQLQTARLQQTMGDVYSSLALGGSLASSYMTAMEPYEQIQAGGKEVGIDVPDLSIKDRIGMMFGKGDDMLIKNYEAEGSDSYQYREDDPLSVKQTHQYSGATLMDIGKRSQAGTLQSYLGDESIGQKFGKDISEQKWWDAKMGQMDSHQPAAQSQSSIERQRTFQRGIGVGGGQGAYGDNARRTQGDLGRQGMSIGPDKFQLQREEIKEDPYYAGTHQADPNRDPLGGGTSGMPGSGQFYDDPYSTTDVSAAATSDLTDYASYDTGYRTSNLHASGYAGMGVDPNAGGQTSMMVAGGAGDTVYYDDHPTDMSGDTLYGRENKRFTHHEIPGYLGQSLRSGEVGDLENNPLQGYESGYDQSWLRPGRSMYSTVGDSLR